MHRRDICRLVTARRGQRTPTFEVVARPTQNSTILRSLSNSLCVFTTGGGTSLPLPLSGGFAGPAFEVEAIAFRDASGVPPLEPANGGIRVVPSVDVDVPARDMTGFREADIVTASTN